jgi:hypothetical protein
MATRIAETLQFNEFFKQFSFHSINFHFYVSIRISQIVSIHLLNELNEVFKILS